jgi:hypothetical protein
MKNQQFPNMIPEHFNVTLLEFSLQLYSISFQRLHEISYWYTIVTVRPTTELIQCDAIARQYTIERIERLMGEEMREAVWNPTRRSLSQI